MSDTLETSGTDPINQPTETPEQPTQPIEQESEQPMDSSTSGDNNDVNLTGFSVETNDDSISGEGGDSQSQFGSMLELESTSGDDTDLVIPKNPNVLPYFVPKVDTDVNAVATDGTNLLIGVPNGKFIVCSDATLELGVSVRYTDETTMPDLNPLGVVVLDRFGPNKKGWQVVLSAAVFTNLPITEHYKVRLRISAVEGEPQLGNGRVLTYDGFKYEMWPAQFDKSSQVAQFILDMGTNRGRYRIGLESENIQTGQLMTSIVEIFAQ